MDVCFVGGQTTAITVDGGAEENLFPWDCGRDFIGTEDANRWMICKDAEGGMIDHSLWMDIHSQSTRM